MGSRDREKVELHQIIVEVDHTDNVESTAAAIEQLIKRFHKKKGLLGQRTPDLVKTGRSDQAKI